jgi:hypothetical protein
MYMGVKAEILSPGMQDARESRESSQIFLICSKFLDRIAADSKQLIVQSNRIGQKQRIEFCGNRKDHMEMVNIKDVLTPPAYPLFFLERLTLRAMTVSAGVIGIPLVVALGVWTVINMTSQYRSSAVHNCSGNFLCMGGNKVVTAKLVKGSVEYVLQLSHGYSSVYRSEL